MPENRAFTFIRLPASLTANFMISTLELQNFRGLEHVKFENLGRANLIIGGNNTGKTSVLEALVALYGTQMQYDELPRTFRAQPRSEQYPGSGFLKSRVGNQESSKCLVQADDDKFEVEPSPPWGNSPPWEKGETNIDRKLPRFTVSILSTTHADPSVVSELFNQIAPLNPKNETKLEELLRKSIDLRLKILRYAKPQGSQTHLVYVDLGEGPMLPFTQLGQAFARTLQIYCEIFANCPKILLIDEIENGLYYEGMEDFWKGLMAVLKDQDVQLFATTHSRECMEAAQRAADTIAGDPLRFLRLDRRVDDPGKIVATTFGKEEMRTAMEFNREMR
jgi:predicted ATP-dependent endonuclease of OLD family